jgi:hypothetical protein
LRPFGVFGAIVGRADRPEGALASFFEQVGASMKRDGLDARFGDPRAHDPEGLRSLFGAPRFRDAQHQDSTLDVEVAGDELWSFFQNAYYELDMSSDREARTLRAWVADHADLLAPGGTMRWRFATRSFRVVRGKTRSANRGSE